MFYAQFVLSKKGPLAKIWLAAHWEKKLSKAQIYETNVQDAVDEIMKPKVKMALRTTGHLLLGIVRIYSRKTKYLLADCNEAFLKIKMAFRPGQDELIDDGKEAPANITGIPEVYADFDTALPDFNDAEFANHLQISQSRIDDITLKEDLIADPSKNFFSNDFGMDDFGEGALGVGASFGQHDFADFAVDGSESDIEAARDRAISFDSLGQHPDISLANGNFSRDLREPTPANDPNMVVPGTAIFNTMDDDFGAGGACDFGDDMIMDGGNDLFQDNASVMNMDAGSVAGDLGDDLHLGAAANNLHGAAATAPADESFVLEPLDASALDRLQEKRRRKRRLLIDEPKNIGGDEMKANMSDYSDTLQTLDLAPPTRHLMKLKEMGVVEKLFHMPGCSLMRAKPLIRMYQSHLVLRARVDDNSERAADIRRELEMSDAIEDDIPLPQPSEYGNGGMDDFDDFGDMPMGEMRDTSPLPMMDMDEQGGGGGSISGVMDVESPVKEAEECPTSERKRRKLNESSRTEDDEAADGDEDHRWTKRTQGVLNSISSKLRSNGDEILLTDLLTKGSTRKTAAQKFYTLLVLKKWQAIDVRQEQPYGDIFVSAGPNIAQTVDK